jgi:alpha-galactosidase
MAGRRRRTDLLLAASAMALLGAAPFAAAQEIRTPIAAPTPRVNGPSVFGVRPGSPLIYKIPATGSGTLTYSATGLPAGVSVDPATGMISGSISTPGNYSVTLQASNSLGTSTKNFTIKVGDTVGLTPAMGWNSWNVWAGSVTAAKVYAAADAFVSHDLINHGWSYVNTDDYWQGARGGTYNGIQGNSTFLAGGYTMQGMIDHIHSLGLKAGIYSTPWIQSYGGFIGGSANNPEGTWVKVTNNTQKVDGIYSFAQNDANQWAAWGIDYLKYDWNPRSPNPVSNAQFHTETETMRTALNNVNRDIIYSYSNSMPFDQIPDQRTMLNSWRTGGDITDSYSSMSGHAFGQDQWGPYSSPGHFNDPDMLEVGWVGKSATPHSTNLSPDEQYQHITMWSLLSSPLLLGNDLTKLDPFTENLLTNDEVLAVNQDALGQQALLKNGGSTLRVYAKDLEDGTKAVGLINSGTTAATVTANWSDLGLSGPQAVRDLWRQLDLGNFDGKFQATVAGHGAELFKLSAPLAPVTTLTWTAAEDLITWDTSAVNFNDGASNVAFYPGAAVAFTDSAPGAATMINVAENVAPSTVTVSSDTRNYFFQGAGAITGPASLIKDGGSTLTILNANSYTGTTLIRRGTLTVGGTDGSLGSGNVINGGSLVFNRSNTAVIANNIGGTGTMTHSGAGTLILTGTNTISGSTQISTARTLQIGNGGATGSLGTGGIVNNGTLIFNRTGTLVAPHNISGTGTLVKNGAGTVILSTNSTYSGATMINDGILTVSRSASLGAIPGGDVTVAGSGTLNLGGGLATADFINNFGQKVFHIAGNGGGRGAITNRDYFADPTGNTGASQQMRALLRVVLDGDATIAAPSLGFDGAYVSGDVAGRIDIRGTTSSPLNASLTLNGHTLTKSGSSFFDLVNCDVLGTGNIVVRDAQSTLCLEGSTRILDDGGASKVLIGDGAMLEFWAQGQGTTLTRRVEMGDGTPTSVTYLSQGGGSNYSVLMPILLKSNLIIRPTYANQNNSTVTLAGAITQDATPRKLIKTNIGTLALRTPSSFTGGIDINVGTAPVNGTGSTTGGVVVTGANAIHPANIVSFAPAPGFTSIFQLNGNNLTLAGLSGGGTGGTSIVENGHLSIDCTLTLNTPGDQTFAGTIQRGAAGVLSLTKTGSGTQTLAGSGMTWSGATTIAAGKLALAGDLSFVVNLSLTGGTLESTPAGTRFIHTRFLSVTGSGRVDLQDNKLIADNTPVGTLNGSAYTDITGLIQAGRIVSSQTNATGGTYTTLGVAKASEVVGTTTNLWAGQFVSGDQALVMYTYGGDANLDGKIDILDYVRIDQGIAAQLTGWFNGDFNYDGKINIQDYAMFIDQNIVNQGAPFPTSAGADAIAVPEPGGIGLGNAAIAPVPEPAGFMLAAGGWLLALRRRSRRDGGGGSRPSARRAS